MEVCGECVAACLSVFPFRRECVPRQSQPLRLGGTVMVSQNSVLRQKRVFRATAFGRPCVVIVARTCKSKFVPTSRLLFAGKQKSRLGKRSVERLMWLRVVRLTTPRTLFQCSKWWTHATYRREGSPDTCRYRVVFPGTHHMRDRRIAEMSVVVLGQPKIKTILCKRPSPAERELRIVGLCKCLFDVICLQHQIGTYT